MRLHPGRRIVRTLFMQFGNIQSLLLLWIVPALVFFYLWAGMLRRRRINIDAGMPLPKTRHTK